MKAFINISLSIIAICALIFLYVTWVNEKAVLSYEGEIAPNEIVANKTAVNTIQLPTSSNENELRIEKLKNQAKKRHQEIINLTGANSGKNQLKYEDDWCVATEDLTEEDQAYALEQSKEWKLSRAKVSLSDIDSKSDLPDSAEVYLSPYKHMDKETLIRLGKQDDMMALTAIIQSPGYDVFNEGTKLYAAQKLVTLGDTSTGLETLVINEIVQVKLAKNLNKGNAIKHLKSALALIEFGMMRNDSTSLEVFLDSAIDYKARLNGVNPALLTDNDFDDIKNMAKDIYDEINKNRIDNGLPSFEEINNTKIGKIYNSKKLFWFYSKYPSLMKSSIFPEHWKNSYLKKSPCVNRRIAMYNFRNAELPEIKKEIANIEQGMN
ncbi:hypothetical protein DXV75_16590 [Alteromonas aestuariivivens]|uniref:Uncharacterized protein n=1 Tax=Alteromonas aestuariivivens TaxID=1938339 RepID=A0A3D8M2T7_9ALTE|nr:hypothetical protein [Alteromonas aestuariivivens]RDV23920.1 hypothetical protein DXV75_16590 [Alteromonas aestuariivivens]